MAVSAVSSSDNSYWQGVQSTASQRRQDVKALADALKKGDLDAAQTAFANLKSLQNPRSADQASATQASSSTTATSPLQALATALQSGDLAGAQAAFAAVENNHRVHHHHRHHHAAANDPVTTQAAAGDSTSSGDQTAQPIGSTFDVKA